MPSGVAPTVSYAPVLRRVRADQDDFRGIGWNGGRAALPHIPPRAGAVLYGVSHMSMPSFPPNGADLTREEALTMIIASIAMEELALSHILNAEGEKLQYILGTLPGAKPCACPQDVLAVNKSVASLLDVVAQNQMLLKGKLEKVLEACPLPPPPPPPPCRPKPSPGPPPCPADPGDPPCPPQHPSSGPLPRPVPCKAPPCEKSALQLAGQRDRQMWSPDCRLPWRQRSRSGKDICWDGRAPTQIQLNPGKIYLVQYTLNICALSPSEETSTIFLRQSPCGVFTDTLPLCFSLTHGTRTLQHVSVLHPCTNSGCAVDLSLALNAKTPLCVERAVMDIVEL